MSKIILTVGISGSGKSTWTKNYIKENPNTISIGYDKIRSLLFALNDEDHFFYYKEKNFNKKENLVKYAAFNLLDEFLSLDYDVIIDNTSLKKSYIDEFITSYKTHEVLLKIFDTDLNVAINRDSQRMRQVGSSIISIQYERFLKLKPFLKDYNQVL